MVMKVILGIVAVVVLTVGLFAVVVAMQPEDVTYSRSLMMNTSPDRPFAEVNDFKRWNDWSPWAKMDPNMQTAFSGPEAGVGSSYTWKGNDQVGEGRMTIIESTPPSKIAIDLEFIAPFSSRNQSEFTFTPQGDQTNVTWTMSGKNNFVMKAFCLVVDMDKMIGSDFEKGLSAIKNKIESEQAGNQ